MAAWDNDPVVATEAPPQAAPWEHDPVAEPSPQPQPTGQTFAAGSPREIARQQAAGSEIAQGVIQGAKELVPKSIPSLAKMLFYTPVEEVPHSLKMASDLIRGVPVEQAVPESQRLAGFSQKPTREQARIATGIGAEALMGVGAAFGLRAPSLHDTLFSEEAAAKEVIPSATEPNLETSALPAEQGQPAQQETAVQPETRDTRETPAEAPSQKVAIPEKISQVAIRNKDTGVVTTGVNHTDAYLKAHPDALDPDEWSGISKQLTDKYEHGFVTSNGKFVSREEANVIAKGKTGELAHDEIPQKGGEVGEKVQVQKEGQGREGVLSETTKTQPNVVSSVPTGTETWTPIITEDAHEAIQIAKDRAGGSEPLRKAYNKYIQEVGSKVSGQISKMGEFQEFARKVAEEPQDVSQYFEAATVQPPAATSGGRTTGIAQRVFEKRGLDVEPGEGITPEEQRARGLALKQSGADPEAVANKIQSGHAVTADETSLARVHLEDLAKESARLQDSADADPKLQPQADAAFNAETSFAQRIKPAATQWQRTGAAMQGEVDIDTGSFNALQREAQTQHGRPFTESEVPKAKEFAGNVKTIDKDIQGLQKNIYDNIDQFLLDLGDNRSFKGRDATEVKAILEHARREYIDPGNNSFDQVVHGTAIDLGLKPDDVRSVLSGPKGSKKMTDEMYGKMSKRRVIDRQAKEWVRGLNEPKLVKVAKGIYHAPFSVAVAGHVVGMETHSGANLFRPVTGWKTFFPNIGREYRAFAQPAFHEKMINDMVNHPRYYFWKRAGAAIDPKVAYDPYQQYSRFNLGAIGRAGDRSMDVLKRYRLDELEEEWRKTPASLKTGDYAKQLSKTVNLRSGAGDPALIGKLSNLAFAAKLESARWGRIFGEPARTIKTGAKVVSRLPTTEAERQISLVRLKRAAEFAGFYLGSLYVNNALLQAFGSNQRVNFTNFDSPNDLLKFKWGGKTHDLTGGLLQPLILVGNELRIAAGPPPARGEKRWQVMAKTAASYGRGKLQPFYGTIADLVTQSDFTGRPMPYSSDKPPKGTTKYTWPEYLIEQRGPIPLSGAAREVADIWKEKGMSSTQIDEYLRAAMVLAEEGRGIKVGREPVPKQEKQSLTSKTPLLAAPAQ